MEPNPFTGQLDKSFKLLRSWPVEQLDLWLIGGLKYHTFFPMPITVSEDPSKSLVDFYKKLVNKYAKDAEEVFNLIGQRIIHLFLRFDYRVILSDGENQIQEIDFMIYLLDLIEEFRLLEINKNLTENIYHKIDKGLYKNKIGSFGNDVHQQLLKVAFSFPPYHKRFILKICREQIHEPAYATIAYKKLWEIDKVNGIKYLPELFKTLENSSRKIAAEPALTYFLEQNRHIIFQQLKNHINGMHYINKFSNDSIPVFVDILNHLGYPLTDPGEFEGVKFEEYSTFSNQILYTNKRVIKRLKDSKHKKSLESRVNLAA